DVFGGKLCVLQRPYDRVAHEGLRRLPRFGPPCVDRLADADDGGVREHALSSLPPSMLAFTHIGTVADATRMKSEIRDGMTIDWDAPIEMDDGVTLRADVFRPIADG